MVDIPTGEGSASGGVSDLRYIFIGVGAALVVVLVGGCVYLRCRALKKREIKARGDAGELEMLSPAPASKQHNKDRVAVESVEVVVGTTVNEGPTAKAADDSKSQSIISQSAMPRGSVVMEHEGNHRRRGSSLIEPCGEALSLANA